MQTLVSSLNLLPPNQSRRNLYHSVLTSSSNLTNLSLISTLGPTQKYHADHHVVKTAYGHTGCINSLHFEEGGEDRIASTGDDTSICLWKIGASSSSIPSTNDSISQPSLNYGLVSKIETGHTANIFSVKFAPFTPERLWTAAGDDQIRVFDLNTMGSNSITYSGNRSWNHYDTTCCTRVIKCHTDRVKKICNESSPYQFLTCSEDGTVRQHDLRTSHTCGRGFCPPPLVSYPALSLYSLSVSKLRPYMFVVGGTSRWAFLHDRRMIRSALQKDWNIELDAESDCLTQCVRRFGVPRNSSESNEHISNHVIATKLSDLNPTELIVSYSNEKIYLFDTDSTSAESSRETFISNFLPKPKISSPKVEKSVEPVVESGSSNNSASKREHPDSEGENSGSKKSKPASDVERVEDPSEVVVDRDEEMKGIIAELREYTANRLEDESSDDESEIEGEVGDGGEDLEIERTASETEEVENGEGDDGSDDDDEDDSEDEDEDDNEEEEANVGGVLDSLDPFSRHHSSPLSPIPIISPRQLYAGHLNVETVKDLNFAFGEKYVMSGSDDGNFFIWGKESGKLEGIYEGDESIVNVLQPHPTLPLIAISGISNTFKIFGPTSDSTKRVNLISQAAEITKKNKQRGDRRRGRGGAGGDAATERAQALFSLLAARIGRDGEIGEDGNVTIRLADGTEESCLLM